MKKGVDAQVSGVSGFILNPFLKAFSPWKGEAAFYDWVGLTEYPENYRSGSKYKHSGIGPYILPAKHELDSEYLGATLLDYDGDKALTFACGACHLGNLFGRPVLGLNNKLPSAFDFMSMGVEMTKRIHPIVIETVGGLSKGEKELLKIHMKVPSTLELFLGSTNHSTHHLLLWVFPSQKEQKTS